MRTTLDIPAKLIEEAMRITKARTKSEAIRTALELLIKQEQRMKLLTFKGKVDLEIDLDTLRKRK
ncbi:MAG: type II toxin-antitoxin system VapB family antitoxin [Saprospiraceae bacterium]|nr:type II toxin-antitoxin system VapB family antitoxin [Saprospiraceae bacterium]